MTGKYRAENLKERKSSRGLDWAGLGWARPGGFSSTHVTQLNESQQGPGPGPQLTTRKTFNTTNHSIDLQHYQLLVCCSADFLV